MARRVNKIENNKSIGKTYTFIVFSKTFEMMYFYFYLKICFLSKPKFHILII